MSPPMRPAARHLFAVCTEMMGLVQAIPQPVDSSPRISSVRSFTTMRLRMKVP